MGAGAGRNTPRYAGFERVVLLDYSTTQLAQAQERLGDGKRFLFVAADIYHLPFVDALFDCATMVRTLHHMADASAALQQVANVMQANSAFILEFANKRNVKAIGRFFLGKQKWNPFSPEPVEFENLNFDFHPKTIRRWLRQVGFSIHRSLTVSHFRLGWLKQHIPLRMLAKLDAALQWTGAFCQYTPSVFLKSTLLTKKPNALPEAFFKCPKCSSFKLVEKPNAIVCSECKKGYPIVNGMYDFRLNEN